MPYWFFWHVATNVEIMCMKSWSWLHYQELATYREQIQFANKIINKLNLLAFHWRPSICLIFTPVWRTHLRCRATHMHSWHSWHDIVWYSPRCLFPMSLHRQCSRCNSFDHLVRDCTFPVPDQMKETLPAQKLGRYGRNLSGNRPFGDQLSTWKYVKWYSLSRQEGCNLFQRKACYQI